MLSSPPRDFARSTSAVAALPRSLRRTVDAMSASGTWRVSPSEQRRRRSPGRSVSTNTSGCTPRGSPTNRVIELCEFAGVIRGHHADLAIAQQIGAAVAEISDDRRGARRSRPRRGSTPRLSDRSRRRRRALRRSPREWPPPARRRRLSRGSRRRSPRPERRSPRRSPSRRRPRRRRRRRRRGAWRFVLRGRDSGLRCSRARGRCRSAPPVFTGSLSVPLLRAVLPRDVGQRRRRRRAQRRPGRRVLPHDRARPALSLPGSPRRRSRSPRPGARRWRRRASSRRRSASRAAAALGAGVGLAPGGALFWNDEKKERAPGGSRATARIATLLSKRGIVRARPAGVPPTRPSVTRSGRCRGPPPSENARANAPALA